MSYTAPTAFAPSTGLIGRLLNTIDRLLMNSAQVAIRNGEPTYPGL